MAIWKTAHRKPGVRYREHPSRKHNGKPDRYFVIRYSLNGKSRDEVMGWASQGMNAEKAFRQRNKLIEAQKTGIGVQTLREQKELAEQKRREKERQKAQASRNGLTFSHLFETQYFPHAVNNKSEQSTRREKSLHGKWIKPIIGDLTFKQINVDHLEDIKTVMSEAGKSPRTIQYALAVVRQVFNYAKTRDLFEGTVPTRKVKVPKIDNRRERFLSPEEAERLLAGLKASSQQTYEIALVSLHCGLRAGEIFNLQWDDLDFAKGLISIRDTKTYRNRSAHMSEAVKAMLSAKEAGKPGDLVFKKRDGSQHTEVPSIFREVVIRLGFNEGITDRRRKVVFHTLRHTYASWLAENGTGIYLIKELLGHSTVTMAERYAHLGDQARQQSVAIIDEVTKR